MDVISALSSQRALLEAFVPNSAALGASAITHESLSMEFEAWADEPAILRRTKESKSESAFRYANAEQFFRCIEAGVITERSELLYRIGIVQQLAISSWLFAVGFDDEWCRHHIGLRIAKSLGYANASGFDYYDPRANLLAALLTPYGKWRSPTSCKSHDGGPFNAAEMIAMTRQLLDHVQRMTGHASRQ